MTSDSSWLHFSLPSMAVMQNYNKPFLSIVQMCQRTRGCRQSRQPSCWCQMKIVRCYRPCSVSLAMSRPPWRRTRWHPWILPCAWPPHCFISTSSRKTISHQSNFFPMVLDCLPPHADKINENMHSFNSGVIFCTSDSIKLEINKIGYRVCPSPSGCSRLLCFWDSFFFF